eukprot:IDg18320t1
MTKLTVSEDASDSAFRVCASATRKPYKMLELLDTRYASKRAASRIATLISVYSKRFNGKASMCKYIEDFNHLFSQIESMDPEASIPESHKAPLLLASIRTESVIESTIAALRLKDIKNLTWESVPTDLIQESNLISRLKKNENKKMGPRRNKMAIEHSNANDS